MFVADVIPHPPLFEVVANVCVAPVCPPSDVMAVVRYATLEAEVTKPFPLTVTLLNVPMLELTVLRTRLLYVPERSPPKFVPV